MNAEELKQQKLQRLYWDKMEKYIDREEEEKAKPESQKRHEKYLRNIKRRSNPMDLEVQPAKKEVRKPGTYFYGNLRKLAEDFDSIEEMFKYMTNGQMLKYYEEDGKLFRTKDKELVYDPETGECFE